jgi:hypothetical protein
MPDKPRQLPFDLNRLRTRYGNFIGGAWKAPLKRRYFTDKSPIDGSTLCEVARSDADDVERAQDAAHAARGGWGRTALARSAPGSNRFGRRDRLSDPQVSEVRSPAGAILNRLVESVLEANASAFIENEKVRAGRRRILTVLRPHPPSDSRQVVVSLGPAGRRCRSARATRAETPHRRDGTRALTTVWPETDHEGRCAASATESCGVVDQAPFELFRSKLPFLGTRRGSCSCTGIQFHRGEVPLASVVGRSATAPADWSGTAGCTTACG